MTDIAAAIAKISTAPTFTDITTASAEITAASALQACTEINNNPTLSRRLDCHIVTTVPNIAATTAKIAAASVSAIAAVSAFPTY